MRFRDEIIVLKTVVFLALLLPGGYVQATDIYKCTINGRLVFTDQPCDGELIQIKTNNTLETNGRYQVYSSGQWYIDYAGYQEAVRISEQENAPLFVYFQADWCGYCRRLEKNLFNTYRGKEVLKKAVKVKITPEHGEKEDAFFQRLGGTGYPSVYVKKVQAPELSKVRLMKKNNGVWVTQTADYLETLIGF